MALQQSIDLALSSKIGDGGLPGTAISAAETLVAKAVERLRNDYKAHRLPLLSLPEVTEDLAAIEEMAAKIRKDATDVVILGTGGSSLGAQTLAQLRDYKVPGLEHFQENPRIHFMDNLDPQTFGRLLQVLPLATTRFVAVSKSGGTGETLMQSIAVLALLEKSGLKAKISELVFGLSEPRKQGGKNALRDLLEPEGVGFLEHDPNVGGRYSVLTNVGLLPAAILGLDIKAIRKGAGDAIAALVSGAPANSFPAAIGASLNLAAIMEGKNIAVIKAYADKFERMTRWWVQLWAESLGKDGKGTTPVAAIGPVDQHSQLQLYLAGPSDKLFTVITTGVSGKGPVMDTALSNRASEPEFANKHIGDMVAAQGRATADTLARNGRPTRRMHIESLDERSLGELLMHFMLETILTGYGLGVDPFDQPAVEEGKILAKKYLAEG
ncbi:glucose-6-phosphate isomerase [Microvirga sp. W0021]|uniref:Glucose-6-phosphate isomerase n=1 Tax=Hohaiivirga grylli TaxID=3133970 RepID=A0ABV0BHJ9_9HYPH